ncbi:glycosyltransferase family 4 protein [Cysteiniphilum sp. JM-1]|uniref:glycosyltransferase family 4 protein n=1 Tax=Cysteiniphilum sp. JM-1 TaxID=2610891 RepID=UPI0012440614|nr:glycosyltransferase family 4 protein [Cysteiniphilum sp. JM-1]
MKILILTDDYLPKSKKASAKMLHELACEFIKRGHEVSCVTPNSYGEADYQLLDEVRIYRFKTGKVKDTNNRLRRVINEWQFSRKAWKLVIDQGFKPDAVVYYSPSIFFGKAVARIKQHFNIPSYLILRDFFPQWVIDQGIIKENSLPARVLRKYEDINYQAADRIGVMLPANLDWFNQFTRKQYQSKVEVLYNWVDASALAEIKPDVGFRKKYQLEDKVIFIYGGNIGHAQRIENIVELARRLKLHPKAQIVLIGQGSKYQFISEIIQKEHLNNILLLPGLPQSEYFAIQKVVDVGLFSLHKDHKTHNFPGKVLGYLSQPMPILGSVNPGNDLIDVVEGNKAGFVSIADDDEMLYQNALQLLDNKSLRQECAVNAQKLVSSLFSVEVAADKVIEVLNKW